MKRSGRLKEPIPRAAGRGTQKSPQDEKEREDPTRPNAVPFKEERGVNFFAMRPQDTFFVVTAAVFARAIVDRLFVITEGG